MSKKQKAKKPPAKIVPAAVEPVRSREKSFLKGVLLILLALVVYIPALGGTFLWDDVVMVRENQLVTGVLSFKTVWFNTDFPLSLIFLWIEWLIWGTKTIGYHVVNVLLHGFGAILVWQILRAFRIRGAWLAGAIFAIHPVCVASVAWISELKNTLSLVLFLLSALFYFQSDDLKSNCKYWLSLLIFLLALLAKTSTVALPVVLLVVVWWRNNRIAGKEIIRVAPFFVLALVFGLMTVWFQSHQAMAGESVQKENLLARSAAAGWAIWFYLYKSLLPVNLSMIYPHREIDPLSAISWLPIVALVALVIWFWRNRGGWGRPALAALIIFVALLFPVLGFFDMYFLVYSRVADHFQYLGLLAAVAFAAAVIETKLPPKLFKPASVILLAFLATLTFQRAHAFQTEETLWSDTLEKNPMAWSAHNNLGNAFSDRGETGKAIDHYLDALKINPAAADAENNLGVALVKVGNVDDAIAHHRQAVKFQSRQPKFHFNLGAALARARRFDEAIVEYHIALQQKTNYAGAHNNLSNVLLKQGKTSDALAEGLKALEIKANFPEGHFNVANAFSALGKSDDALAHFAEAVKLKPDFTEAHFAWGIELAMLGKMVDAEKHFREAARLKPGDSDIRVNLANTLGAQEKLNEAIAEYQSALGLDPNNSEANYYLGLTLLKKGNQSEAVKYFREALRLNPNYIEAKQQLSTLESRK